MPQSTDRGSHSTVAVDEESAHIGHILDGDAPHSVAFTPLDCRVQTCSQ